jgi:hypothetical protein
MNWDAIGAIGEIVGAIAVVATLLYVARQMRESRAAMERQATVGSASMHAQWRQTIMANTDLAKAIAKANKKEELEDEDVILLSTLADDLFVAGVAAYANITSSGSLHDAESELEYMAKILTANPGLKPHWVRFRYVVDAVSSEYGAGVDIYLAKTKDEESIDA